jgi:hypothetical protein
MVRVVAVVHSLDELSKLARVVRICGCGVIWTEFEMRKRCYAVQPLNDKALALFNCDCESTLAVELDQHGQVVMEQQ